MQLATLGRLALKHVRNAFAEELYLHSRQDLTRPVTVYAIVNERCNYKCRYCAYWRLPYYAEEMSVAQWQDALASLREFIGPYHVEFSGGEPFIKQGFLDLCRWCRDHDIRWGVTTNGSALNGKVVAQVVDARPFNVNVSMDSHLAETHDYARGVDGSFAKITRGIRDLIARRDAAGLDFPVIIKPVVHRLNYAHLPAMVEWAREIGAAAVNMQPIDRWTRETYDELWIEEAELPRLMAVARELIRLKRAGAPILNSELLLASWDKHFREEPAPAEVMPCRVGMRNYFIRPNGNVEVCWNFPPIGNVRTGSARDIWYGEVAAQRRAETVACEKLCLFTCLSQKSVADKVKMGLTLLGGNREKQPAAPRPSAIGRRVHLPVVSA
jgi:MoaA/NifB/PqqE/SkfB family radical SAM enzyme